MSDITAKTMVPGFKRLPQRAYLGGYTSYFGSRTHFQLATFYALTETPEGGLQGDLARLLGTSQLAGLLETNFVAKPVRLLARWLARWFGLEFINRSKACVCNHFQVFDSALQMQFNDSSVQIC